VTVPNMRLPAVPIVGCPPRARLRTGSVTVRPLGAEAPAFGEPPFDPTELAVPTEDPLDDPLELGAGRSVAVPDDDDPGGAVRP
jgi:hypothetical protein